MNEKEKYGQYLCEIWMETDRKIEKHVKTLITQIDK